MEEINFELGVGCLEKNDYSQAIKYFLLVLQKNPKNIQARYNLSLAYKKAGMTQKAVEESDKLVQILNSDNISQSKEVNVSKLRNENKILHSAEFDSKKFEAHSKIKTQENDYIEMADMHFDSQQIDTAKEYYNLALNINPYNDYTYYKMALCNIEQGNYVEAEPFILKAAGLSPQNSKYDYYKNLVNKNINTKFAKSTDLREQALNQVIAAKKEAGKGALHGFDMPVDYKKQLFADSEYYSDDTIQKNQTEQVKALPAKADNAPAKLADKIGGKFLKQKKDEENKNKEKVAAQEQSPVLQQASFAQGKSQELDYLDMADLHYDNQEYETAIDYYNLALNLNENNDYTYYKLARCYIDTKQYQKADKFIEKALLLSSMNKKYLYFKNEITAGLKPTAKIAYLNKSPADYTKNKPKDSAASSYKLNPNLKMIPEDANLEPEEESSTVNAEEIKIPAENANKKKQNNNISAFPNFLSQAGGAIQSSFGSLKEKVFKLKLKNEQPLNQQNNKEIASVGTVQEETVPTIFGKDPRYFESQEKQNTQKIPEYTFEKPLKTEVKPVEYTADYYNQKGVEYYEQDNLQKAENFFKKAVELKPMYAKAYNNLANVEAKRGNFEQAIVYNTQAIQIDPIYPEAYYNMALIYKKKRDLANEIIYLDKAVEADPKFYQAYFARGLAYYNSGNYEQAKYNFNEVLKYKNDHYVASQNLGIIYANELNQKEAESHFKTAIRLNKNNPEPYYYIASIYQLSGRVIDAIYNFEKTIELDSANYKAYLALSRAYDQNDETDKAIDILNDAIVLNQSNAEPYNYLGLLYLKKDKYVEATKSFQKAVELNPSRAVYHYNLSQSYICLNMKTRARTEFQKAAATVPKSVQDYIDLSEIFYDRSMPTYSIKILNEGIASLSNNDYLYVELSKLYEKTGAISSARKTLQDYLLIKPHGTLSLLVQRKLNNLQNSSNSQNSY